MLKVNEVQSIKQLFDLASNSNDDQMRHTIFAKIKENKNLEDEIIDVLKENNPYVFLSVYDFLDSYKIEHPEVFIEPINLNLTKMNSSFQEIMDAPFGVNDFESLNIGLICGVLNKYFKESSSQFRPNILAIQKTLEPEPKKRSENDEQFKEYLNTYRREVKSWLDAYR